MVWRSYHRSLCSFVDVPVPQITAKLGDSVQPVPLERTHERIVEQISVVPQTTEKVAYCIQDQILEVPVPLITDKIVDDVFGLPQEGVQNRATFTGKVFTVCDHFDDQACTDDNVGFIQGLDKNNMPRPGDVLGLCTRSTRAPWQ